MPLEPPVTSATLSFRFKEAIRVGEGFKFRFFREGGFYRSSFRQSLYKVGVNAVADASLFFSAYKRASAMNRRKSD